MNEKGKTEILVTGGGGFLGKAIVKQLVENGETVTSFSRGYYPELKALGVKQIQGDLGDRDAVTNALQGMDLVFHVAAKAGVWGRYNEYYVPNVLGTKNIIDACRLHQVGRLVYTSSPSVVFDGHDMEGVNESVPYPAKSHNNYTKTKTIAEKEITQAANQGLNVITLRPHLIWGPEDPHLVKRIVERAHKLVRVGNKNSFVDTIYIDNAAEAHILAAKSLLEKPELSGKIYFISNSEPVPIWDIVNGILQAAGLDPITKTVPHKLVWTVGAVLEFVYKVFMLKGEPVMTRFVADELATAHWFDITAAKTDLGYIPRVSIQEGLSRLQQWMREGKGDG